MSISSGQGSLTAAPIDVLSGLNQWIFIFAKNMDFCPKYLPPPLILIL